MPLIYKIDILAALKDAGYNTTKLRKDKLLSESTIQKFRTGQIISPENLATLCELLHCQPGDLIEYVSANLTDMTKEEQQAERRAKDRNMILEASKNGSAVEVKTKKKKKHPFSLLVQKLLLALQNRARPQVRYS